ncbi:MAG TPA: hypothetical protein VFZ09_27775 [Archangium sp.]|uniref:hypothetical protein n=1 Tax=Archangium sp. TaxID=1872627 RepID=UPI002E346B66|nr:hypothetical protein [Archangium sp.]HEX5750061.1 hypothetical protein [Archangium sp.]
MFIHGPVNQVKGRAIESPLDLSSLSIKADDHIVKHFAERARDGTQAVTVWLTEFMVRTPNAETLKFLGYRAVWVYDLLSTSFTDLQL